MVFDFRPEESYRFFLLEVPDLLRDLETELLSLRHNYSPEKVKTLIRIAHSIKGGAACAGLSAAQQIAHSLESLFEILATSQVAPSQEVETLLLAAYDRLSLPLITELQTHNCDWVETLQKAEEAFRIWESQLLHEFGIRNFSCGDATRTEFGISPAETLRERNFSCGDATRTELTEQLAGVEASAAFSEDICRGLERWVAILSLKEPDLVAEALKVQSELFRGLGNLLQSPTIVSIAQQTFAALEQEPDKAIEIGQIALQRFQSTFFKFGVSLAETLRERSSEFGVSSELVQSPEFGVQSNEKPQIPNSLPIASLEEQSQTANPEPQTPNSEPRTPNSELSPSEFRIPNSEFKNPLPLNPKTGADQLELLDNLVGELVTQDHSFLLQKQQYRESLDHLQRWVDRFGKTFIVPKQTELQEEVAHLQEILQDFSLVDQRFQQLSKQRQRTLKQIQGSLLQARMMPAEALLRQFSRVVRDLAVGSGKQARLELVGSQTLVNRSVLEKLYDPLIHLIRNALDHSIEPPDLRQSLGKASEGTITITTYHRGNQITIEIQDDGQGIDLEKIRTIVAAQHHLSPTEAAQLSPADLQRHLFLPGFSTVQEANTNSGRGMGLATVQQQMGHLKGTVSIRSQCGQGTTFTLSFPLNSNILRLLIFQIQNQLFAVPVDTLQSIQLVLPQQIVIEKDQQFYYWNQQKIQLADRAFLAKSPIHPPPPSFLDLALSALPNAEQDPLPNPKKVPLLILNSGSQPFALQIDEIVTDQDLVVKPFNPACAPPPYLCGCTVLGDGRLVPILETSTYPLSSLEDLLNSATSSSLLRLGHLSTTGTSFLESLQRRNSQFPSAFTPNPKRPTPTILIVDDSLTIRKTLAATLQRAGYRVKKAKDGWGALQHLQENQTIRLVICDIEMPRMTGLEFLRNCREHLNSTIPVIILTSRSSDRYRSLAQQLGATDYLTKPFMDQDLLDLVRTYLDQKN
jgi:chemotaxis family two-component system sensor histidine kinase/response regulator PixL